MMIFDNRSVWSSALRWAIGGVLFAMAPVALGHDGPRIWVGNEQGRLTTLGSDNDFDPAYYRRENVFPAVFSEFSGIYTTEFPGFEVRRDNDFLGAGAVGMGTRMGFNVVSQLSEYHPFEQVEDIGAASPTFGSMPKVRPTHREYLLIGSGGGEILAGAGPMGGFDFFDFFGVGDHAHLVFTFVDENRQAARPRAEFYTLRMELTSPQMASSEPFFIVFARDAGVDASRLEAAVQAIRQASVPEPTMLTAAVVAGWMMVRRRGACVG
jgi:hypothetical protein